MLFWNSVFINQNFDSKVKMINHLAECAKLSKVYALNGITNKYSLSMKLYYSSNPSKTTCHHRNSIEVIFLYGQKSKSGVSKPLFFH